MSKNLDCYINLDRWSDIDMTFVIGRRQKNKFLHDLNSNQLLQDFSDIDIEIIKLINIYKYALSEPNSKLLNYTLAKEYTSVVFWFNMIRLQQYSYEFMIMHRDHIKIFNLDRPRFVALRRIQIRQLSSMLDENILLNIESMIRIDDSEYSKCLDRYLSQLPVSRKLTIGIKRFFTKLIVGITNID